jgi:type II secretory pathway pseudopilin PulG
MHRPEQLKGMTMSPIVCSFSKKPADKSFERGITLVELLVSMTVGIILITFAFGFINSQTNNLNENRQTSEMQQELRWALQFTADHVKLSGNAVPTACGYKAIDNTDGASGAPDSLVILGSFKSLVVTTTQNMASENSQIECSSVDRIEQGDLIMISDGTFSELFAVTAITANRLSHDVALPWNDTNNLDHKYNVGSTLTVLTQFRFFIKTDTVGHPNLMVASQAYPAQVLAGDIDQFQVRFKMKSGSWSNDPDEIYDIREVEITLRARSPQPLKNYRDHDYGDAYKRIELKSMVIPKNLILI